MRLAQQDALARRSSTSRDLARRTSRAARRPRPRRASSSTTMNPTLWRLSCVLRARDCRARPRATSASSLLTLSPAGAGTSSAGCFFLPPCRWPCRRPPAAAAAPAAGAAPPRPEPPRPRPGPRPRPAPPRPLRPSRPSARRPTRSRPCASSSDAHAGAQLEVADVERVADVSARDVDLELGRDRRRLRRDRQRRACSGAGCRRWSTPIGLADQHQRHGRRGPLRPGRRAGSRRATSRRASGSIWRRAPSPSPPRRLPPRRRRPSA